MRDLLISKRYAQAFMDLAVEMNQLEESREDMENIALICKEDKDFMVFLRSPVIMPEKKVSVLLKIFEGKVRELTMNFIRLITTHRREMILDQIVRQFIVLYKKKMNIIPTFLTTALQVSPEVRSEIVGLMENYTKGNIELHEEVDQDLIGGFLLRFEDKEFNASLRDTINQLKKDFEQNPYTREI